MATNPTVEFNEPDQAHATAADRDDIGILCIHGIGLQEQGDTLLSVSQSLLEAMAPDGGKVEYGHAWLKPHRDLVPGPAHLRATVDGPASESTRVLIAESWWAQAFDAPSYGTLLQWLLGHGTWIAIRHVVFRLSWPLRCLQACCEQRGCAVPAGVQFVEMYFGLACAFDLLRGDGDIDGLHLVTYGAGVRKLTELEEDAKSKPFSVRLCAVLVPLGLAMAALAWLAGLYVLQLAAMPATAAPGTPPPSATSAGHAGLLSLGFLSLFVLCMGPLFYYPARERDRSLDRRLLGETQKLLRRGLLWSDFYASADPVPGGPVLGAQALTPDVNGCSCGAGELAGFRSRRVVNRLSALSDHTSYWQGPNDFLAAVASQLRSWASLAPTPGPANLHRYGRVLYRKLAGLLLGLAAIAAFWRVGNPVHEGAFGLLWNLLPIVPDSRTAWIVDHLKLRRLALWALGLGAYLAVVVAYGRFVLDPNWDAWERAVQGLRLASFTGADRGGTFRRALNRAAPSLRLACCTVLFTVPLGVLMTVAQRGSFDPAGDVLLVAGDVIGNVFWATLIAGLAVVMVMVAVQWMRNNLAILQAIRARRRARRMARSENSRTP